MLMSEMIAKAIEEMLNENGGTLELKRNELASRMGCVPSQINYVITSRFGKDRGYIVCGVPTATVLSRFRRRNRRRLRF